MPTTVNGVGTHYYGKRDAVSRSGTCPHCGAQVTLQSYTTRLWFVIVFIPIIPLKRVRLLDYCPRCQRHWVTNPDQYEMSRQLALSGALEKYRDEPSVDNALAVHAHLLQFYMHDEADTFRTTALEQFPDNAELLTGLAGHLEQRGRWGDATPLFEKAFALKPDLADVRHALAWRRMNQNKLDEAYQLLDFLRQPGAGQTFNLDLLETLANLYQKNNQHERVLELCGHLLQERPAAADQFKFRKLVTQSERATHQTQSLLPAKSFSVAGLFDSKSGLYAPWVRWATFGSVATVLFVVGMVGLNEYRRTHRTLYVLNGFAQPITFSVDGDLPITVVDRKSFSVSEGEHRIAINGALPKESVISLQSDYWSRWTNSPAWIFNVEQAALVQEVTVHYATNPQPSPAKWLNESELNYVPHVDYLFQSAPNSLPVKGHQTITKTLLEIVPRSPASALVLLQGQVENKRVQWTFAEGYLNRNPQDVDLLESYVNSGDTAEDEVHLREFLQAGLWRTPLSVPWHRAYQNLKSVIVNEAAVAADYDAHLIEDPDNATLLYLRGRVGATRAEQVKFFQLAKAKDPQFGWPAFALAYDAANRGEWGAAKELCDNSVLAMTSDPSIRGFLHQLKIANGEAATLEAGYRQQLAGTNYSEIMRAAFLLADTLAAQQKYADARQTIHQWWSKTTRSAPVATIDLLLDYVCADLDAFRQKREQPIIKSFTSYQFQFLLAIDEPDAAVKLDGADQLLEEPLNALALSVSYSLTGNPTEAATWLSKACDELQKSDHDRQRAAALLQRDQAPTNEELDDIVMSLAETPLFLAALAMRFPDRKAELSERARRVNVSRLPPSLLVKKVIDQP